MIDLINEAVESENDHLVSDNENTEWMRNYILNDNTENRESRFETVEDSTIIETNINNYSLNDIEHFIESNYKVYKKVNYEIEDVNINILNSKQLLI
jgi:hypothetical protein